MRTPTINPDNAYAKFAQLKIPQTPNLDFQIKALRQTRQDSPPSQDLAQDRRRYALAARACSDNEVLLAANGRA
jgi:hypothetical protein